jgi:hypothetical protein
VQAQAHKFLTPALGGDQWSAAHPGRLTPAIKSWYPLKSRIEADSRSGHCGEEKNPALRN